MKIKTILLALMFLTLFSCSTDDTNQDDSMKKTSVAFSIDQPPKTGKQIKRGNIPLWVNSINIKAKSVFYPTYEVQDNFTFDEQNGASLITLSDIAIGSNVFTATTTTDSPQFYQLTNYTVNTGTIDQKFDTALDNINNELPYVLYAGTKTETVTETGPNLVQIPMNTNNGRLLSVFQLNQLLKDNNYQAKVTSTYTTDNTTALNAVTKGNELVTFKWSNVNSVQGATVTYKIEVSKINNQNVILKTYSITQDIKASTSISCYYTINEDGIILKKSNEQGITLNFQEWKNEHCTTCK